MYPREPEKGLRGAARDATYIAYQQRWIEYCESNGKSYTGARGADIRRADEAELTRLESLRRFV